MGDGERPQTKIKPLRVKKKIIFFKNALTRVNEEVVADFFFNIDRIITVRRCALRSRRGQKSASNNSFPKKNTKKFLRDGK